MEIDHVHFYVDNAIEWRDWFVHYLGCEAIATTYDHQTCTAVVNSNSAQFFLSSPLTSDSPVANFFQKHPAGVADIAFRVDDLDAVMEKALSAGTTVLQPTQENKGLKWAKILGWGDLCHTLIELKERKSGSIFTLEQNIFSSAVLKCNETKQQSQQSQDISHIDHIVLNVASGDLAPAVAWYQKALSFQPRQSFKIQTERSGLYSQVLVSDRVTLPINEPTSVNSQIQEFLNFNQGPGIQHMALHTDNILSAVAQMRRRGLSFIEVPANYYENLRQRGRLNLSDEKWQTIKAEQILVDWQAEQPDALLMQTFTQPIFHQPTFFFELISRQINAQGFGEGNFQALFEAVEREQLQRAGQVMGISWE